MHGVSPYAKGGAGMRLLILWPDRAGALAIREEMERRGWDVTAASDGRSLTALAEGHDVLLMHLCLPGLDGLSAGDALAASVPLCAMRILFVAPPEWCVHHPFWADCTVSAGSGVQHLCTLISILGQKPLSRLAEAQKEPLAGSIERFLDEMSFKRGTKGRAYAAWLLREMAISPHYGALALCGLYDGCARAFGVTPAAVERCLRAAVESVFTQGSLRGIERFFGATVDPERGKPTNRAFLLQAVQQLRYSFASARSLNSSEMHHKPAAPTSV